MNRIWEPPETTSASTSRSHFSFDEETLRCGLRVQRFRPVRPYAPRTLRAMALAFAVTGPTAPTRAELTQGMPAERPAEWKTSVNLAFTSMAFTAVAARCARTRAPFRALRRARPVPGSMAVVGSPTETYEELVQTSVKLRDESWQKTFFASFMGGSYVGMACLLSFVIGGNIFHNYLTRMAVFATLFPVNLLLILQSGGQLFTGNSATMAMGVLEKKVRVKELIRNWAIAYAGNILGCLTISVLANYCGLITGGARDMVLDLVAQKVSGAFGPTFVKGVMCNWLVCISLWLCTMARGLGGKMLGAWFPVSMFVAIGFEHSVTSMFILPAGLLLGTPFSWMQLLSKNLIPVTLGNAAAGVFVVAASMSFAFGRLGRFGSKRKSTWARTPWGEVVVA
ncbi:unnamed protein product [Durusdinium trenchii]|uniref:Formate/nitrite transporter n=2 Tax=Durusdinium trenchii TaxID=1381693 RepID=A0ABP0L9W7_9DINO